MTISQIAFLVIFFILLKNQTLFKWLFIFAGGLLLSPFLGRFYCSWICPMDTLFKPIDFVYKKLKIKRFKVTSSTKLKILRYILLFSFISIFIITRIVKIRLNLLLYIVGFSVLITLFFEEEEEEELWHKYLCPYGTLLSLFSMKPLTKLRINEEKCTGCGLCQKDCPTNTIIILDNNKRRIINKECLLCLNCKNVCSVNAISFKK
ncbi:4Fe-4S binding protein [Thermosipho atlanticus]|uniref:4Fe-4S binding domain-containing protein n=1 Tax=Thermosipho atlanticus DSM 15807 TaxID=1123380 RepID=A0A1M5SML1_9BACT|nr:4Fe-4S binding protein [Thermosipho atlanticus]SHH39801.1 4Fe-4S binding domain-containing protein [Thermosipho atlanticus DSM 15807]